MPEFVALFKLRNPDFFLRGTPSNPDDPSPSLMCRVSLRMPSLDMKFHEMFKSVTSLQPGREGLGSRQAWPSLSESIVNLPKWAMQKTKTMDVNMSIIIYVYIIDLFTNLLCYMTYIYYVCVCTQSHSTGWYTRKCCDRSYYYKS